MKLYYMPGASSLATRILINEIGLDAKYDEVNRQTKVTESGNDFYSVSNKGLVPVLEISEGKTISESPAIFEYLADTNQNSELLAPVNSLERYETLCWLHFISYELGALFSQINHSVYPDDVVSKVMIPSIESKFEICEKQLANNEYICGSKFSIADSLLVVMIFWGYYYKIDMSKYPNIEKYYSGIKSRPSITKSFEQEGLLGML